MGDIARKSFVATVVAVAVVVGGVRALAPEGAGRAAPARDRDRLGDAARDRVAARAARAPRRSACAIHYLGLLVAIGLLLWLIVPRALDQVQNALGTLPTSTLGRRRGGEALARDQARDPRRASSTGSSGCRSGTGPDPPRGHLRPDRARDPRRHLLHVRGRRLLDLREGAGAGRSCSSLVEARQPEADPRHLGSDRREARCLRPRPAADDHVRQHGALVRLLARSGCRTGC